MKVKISSPDEINKILRSALISLSGLKENRIVNGYTLHGQDLVEQVSKYCYKSYKPEDSYIVFELRPNRDNITEMDYDGNLTINSSYTMHCYVYGNNSYGLVNMILAKLKTQDERLKLQIQGLYLQNNSSDDDNITNGTDFINDTLYPRTDFDIIVWCEMLVQKSSVYDIETAEINVIMEDD